jgi:hypothetical protein
VPAVRQKSVCSRVLMHAIAASALATAHAALLKPQKFSTSAQEDALQHGVSAGIESVFRLDAKAAAIKLAECQQNATVQDWLRYGMAASPSLLANGARREQSNVRFDFGIVNQPEHREIDEHAPFQVAPLRLRIGIAVAAAINNTDDLASRIVAQAHPVSNRHRLST